MKISLDPAATTTQDEETRDSGIGTYDLDFPTHKLGNCNNFIHEPEELSALYDSRRDFPIISPIFDNKMASFVNDEELNVAVNDEKRTLTSSGEDESKKRKQSLQSLDELLESDLSKNKHCTDADVLNAVCVFSERTSPASNGKECTRKSMIL